jgi:hypothetical protein
VARTDQTMGRKGEAAMKHQEQYTIYEPSPSRAYIGGSWYTASMLEEYVKTLELVLLDLKESDLGKKK